MLKINSLPFLLFISISCLHFLNANSNTTLIKYLDQSVIGVRAGRCPVNSHLYVCACAVARFRDCVEVLRMAMAVASHPSIWRGYHTSLYFIFKVGVQLTYSNNNLFSYCRLSVHFATAFHTITQDLVKLDLAITYVSYSMNRWCG